MPDLHANWNYPTAISLGVGRIRTLPDACKQQGMNAPLLVTDPGLAALPFIQETVGRCDAAGVRCAVFSGIRGNPNGQNVIDGVAAYHAGGHDGVIALGGGSALDAGKAVALMAGQQRPLWDFEDCGDNWLRVNEAGMAPVIAVPTTAGTGSEVGRASVITDIEQQRKRIIFHPKMMPVRVILDPELTVSLPAKITAATGMDALSHNLEAFCSPLFHPMAEGIAVEGMRLIKDWLPVAVAEGSNLTARANMLVASSMGATAFQKGLGAMHSLSHPCGSVLNTHHGLTNAVVMPYVLEFNRSAISEKLVRLARFLDLPNPSFDAVQNWVLELREQVGIPHTLKEIGVTEEYTAQLAPMAAADPSSGTNPIPLTAANLEPLYLRCIRGELAGG